MKRIFKFAKAVNSLLMICVILAAFGLMLCGLYVLNDIYYTNRSAFSSYDLLQYRPEPHNTNDDDPQTFSELQEVNSDTVGWIEMFGTNINYPVVQGDNDLEYLNKDIFGYSTLSGSIYLSAENSRNFDDWYNIIYGHHMDNGAMFGDIAKYLDSDFFNSHNEGILQTENGDYNIKVIACIRTNAYEDAVYQFDKSAENKYPELYDYIIEHSENKTELPEKIDGVQLIGLSTCTDAVTNGRIVLFAVVTPWDEAINGIAADKMYHPKDKSDEKVPLTAKGHEICNRKWSLLNLLCVICTFLTLVPVWALRRKFRQFPYSRKMIKRLKGADKQTEENTSGDNNTKIIDDLKHFIKKGRVGLISEFLILLISVIMFILTEDIKGRMGLRDKWTGWMILIAALALTADFICLRYRGIRPESSINKA